MGLIDDARALIQRQVAAIQERAAKEQQRELAQPTYVPLNDEAAQLLREFVTDMRRLGIAPAALYNVVHEKSTNTGVRSSKTSNVFTCTHVLQGWPIVAHCYAVTVDGQMVGIGGLTVMKNSHYRSARDFTSEGYEFRYRGFGSVSEGQSFITLEPDAVRISQDSMVSGFARAYEPEWPDLYCLLKNPNLRRERYRTPVPCSTSKLLPRASPCRRPA